MSKIVCVTGCSGYVGSALVTELLNRGYKVRGAVRKLDDQVKVKHLKNLHPNAQTDLELFEADNTVEGSYDKCFDGADYVLHVASPFFLDSKNPQEELISPAVLGAEYAIQSAKKGNVKRFVLTSSTATLHTVKVDEDSSYVLSENDWNDKSTIETAPYPLSKTLAEKAAWKKAKELDLDMVSILPAGIIGPVFSDRKDGTSTLGMIATLKGLCKDKYPPALYGLVDVRDVALAHILAFEKENGSGRYICSSKDSYDIIAMCEILKKIYPGVYDEMLPIKRIYDHIAPKKDYCTNEKIINELGMEFRNVEDTFRDMVESMKKFNLV